MFFDNERNRATFESNESLHSVIIMTHDECEKNFYAQKIDQVVVLVVVVVVS